jgi:hypothetical protein
MPKWTPLPTEPLKYNPYQDAFWKAHRQRLCRNCHIEYDSPPHAVCPQCGEKGSRKFHRLLLLAGRRGGKTKAASIAAVEEASIPNTIGWCCAPTNPKLHRYVIPAIQELIPPEWVASWSSEFGDLRLKNGSLIHFQTLEDPDQGRGQGLDWVWVDEVCELSLDHWLVLRPSLTERRGGAFFSSSPRSFDWVYDEFFKRAEDQVPGYWACRYKTSDNPKISVEEIDDARATMPDSMFKQEYEADFVIFTGAVYGGAIDAQILRTHEQVRKLIPEWDETKFNYGIAPWRQIIVGVDTGADHPFGAVKLVSTENGFVCVGEYLERDRSFIQHAESLKFLAQSQTTRWAINKNERQPMIELGQHGITCIPAQNDIVAGTERVKSWLHTKQLWFVEPLVPNTIKQLKTYRWADNVASDGSARKEKVYKKNDELPDALRYALMTWPQLPKPVPKGPEQRDLSNLPEKMRQDIERMRRIDKDTKETPDSITGDFYA